MNDEEAQKYSGIMGLMEGTTEMIGIENLSKAGKGIKTLVKDTGKEAVKQGTKEITKSGIKTVLKNYGIGIADNIMQEAIIDPIQELTAQTIAGKDKAQCQKGWICVPSQPIILRRWKSFVAFLPWLMVM